MNNVVYVKTFENGKLYVGITNNFRCRMNQHKHDAFTKNSELPVHRAMRKYNHETEIVFQSECYDDILEMEKVVIQNFKDLGYELYNITAGGQGALGRKMTDNNKEIIRKSNSNRLWNEEARNKMKKSCTYPVNYYENNLTQRGHFKKYCINNNIKFEDFEETFGGWSNPTSSTNRRRLFYYKLKEGDLNYVK